MSDAVPDRSTGERPVCVFCEILAGRHQALRLIETRDAVAFLDHNPLNPGHTLVVPTRHVAAFTALQPVEVQALFAVVQHVARIQLEALGAVGVNYMINQGRLAGQRVFHVHCHVLPRFERDGIVFKRDRTIQALAEIEPVHRRLAAYADAHPLDGMDK